MPTISTAAAHLRRETGAPVAIGSEITKVQATFKALFNAADVAPDGRAFDRLLLDGDRLPLGEFWIEAMHTPGHTPACMTYRVGDAAFVGDTLFMPDYGTARADFPGGDALNLVSVDPPRADLPPATRLFMCHDYRSPDATFVGDHGCGRARAERAGHYGIGEDAYVRFREGRDKTLEMPVLILPSLQVNIRAGNFPTPEDNGTIYLKLPIDRL